MRLPSPDVSLARHQPLVAALDALDAAGASAARIVDGGRVVGILLRDDIVRFVELRQPEAAKRAA